MASPIRKNGDQWFDIGLRVKGYDRAEQIATLVFSNIGPIISLECIGDDEYALEMHVDYDKATRTTVFDFARGALAALTS